MPSALPADDALPPTEPIDIRELIALDEADAAR